MTNCSRCGVQFHPEISACPVCGQVREAVQARRRKLKYLVNTFLFSSVAVIVLLRTLTAGDVPVGMTSADCNQARVVAEQTRFAVDSLANDKDRGVSELSKVSDAWFQLATNYTPGKYSWSSSGREHNWLERLATSTASLAAGEPLATEQIPDSSKYVVELTRLLGRFCS